MNLLLTSSFPMKNNELIAKFIKNLGNDLRILYIGYSDNPRKYCERVKDYGFTNVDYLNITEGFNSREVNEYDVIAMYGGNPFSIKESMNKSGFSEFLHTAKPLIITTSGSSLVLSKNFELFKILYPKMKGNAPEGLNLFPYEIISHSQRYKKKESMIKNYSRGKKVYAIPDGSAIAHDGTNIELIGNVKII